MWFSAIKYSLSTAVLSACCSACVATNGVDAPYAEPTLYPLTASLTLDGGTTELGATVATVFEVLPAQEGQCLPSWVVQFRGAVHGISALPARPDVDGSVLDLISSTDDASLSYHIGFGSEDIMGSTIQLARTDNQWLWHFTEGTICQHGIDGLTDVDNCLDASIAELVLSPSPEVDQIVIETHEAVYVERTGDVAAQNLCQWTPSDNLGGGGDAGTTVP